MTTDNNEVEQLEPTEALLDRDTYRRIKKMDRATLEGLNRTSSSVVGRRDLLRQV